MACDYKAVLTAVYNIYIVPKFLSKRAYAICIFILSYGQVYALYSLFIQYFILYS